MMRIDILSAVPEILFSPLNHSIIKRARVKGKAEIHYHNLRDYAFNKHMQIDDKPYGGGAGMILKPEPFFSCIEKLRSEREYEGIIYTSARGKVFDQGSANRLSLMKNIIFIAGHYKGIDERVIQKYVTEEFSIGNFILTGGELPVLVFVDAIVRLIPGVLNDSESALSDSFQVGETIGEPYYTKPEEIDGMSVPGVLLSGDHNAIKKWKDDESRKSTEIWKRNNNT
ncbi:MAG: tRNA (guanosine(37)-N1)-methyltransferase TrmD [Ignavibacteriaceae bacterium]|nr:tRNA (guanosine(37)-N1)-methyltransferase TrmD [Ignavibacteriaceae bacterium]